MKPTESRVLVATEGIRLAACLVHAVPSAAGAVITTSGDRLLVARHRRDATLDPCRLRDALAAPVTPGVPHFADIVVAIEIVGGLVDIGGGLHQRCHPAAADERWFATPLHPDRVVAIAGTCPFDLPHGSVDVRVCADSLLGVCAVCVAATPGFGCRLDEVAMWLHASCLVEELIESATHGPAPRA